MYDTPVEGLLKLGWRSPVELEEHVRPLTEFCRKLLWPDREKAEFMASLIFKAEAILPPRKTEENDGT